MYIWLWKTVTACAISAHTIELITLRFNSTDINIIKNGFKCWILKNRRKNILMGLWGVNSPQHKVSGFSDSARIHNLDTYYRQFQMSHVMDCGV